jgi:hypothetical protein
MLSGRRNKKTRRARDNSCGQISRLVAQRSSTASTVIAAGGPALQHSYRGWWPSAPAQPARCTGARARQTGPACPRAARRTPAPRASCSPLAWSSLRTAPEGPVNRPGEGRQLSFRTYIRLRLRATGSSTLRHLDRHPGDLCCRRARALPPPACRLPPGAGCRRRRVPALPVPGAGPAGCGGCRTAGSAGAARKRLACRSCALAS